MKAHALGGTCPVTFPSSDSVTLAHGEGGPSMRRLIRERIASKLSVSRANLNADAAILGRLSGDVVITTDSYVVSPLFFPGGDIGSLAVNGTINDLAMMGASPRYLTLSLILEEGLSISLLDRIIESIARSVMDAGVEIVAGDTKVVPQGSADGIFINTTGVGLRLPGGNLGIDRIQPGDAVIVSGPIADHGFAVLCAREEFGFDPPPKSDCKPLHRVAAALVQALGNDLHAMRDATRGGVAAVLHEWAEATGHSIRFDERQIPLRPICRGVSELLGIDPLFVANEGTFVVVVAKHRVDETLRVLREHALPDQPSVLGDVHNRRYSPVLIRRGIGIEQALDEPVAAMLPRIC